MLGSGSNDDVRSAGDPDVLPLTPLGKQAAGTFDLRVFDQGIFWVDEDQRPQRLEDMDPEAVAAVQAFLRVEAEHFFASELRRTLMSAILGEFGGVDARAQIDKWKRCTALMVTAPGEWLESTPLMRALEARRRG